MTLIDQTQLLLDKVGLITWKYRQILQGPEYRFNVFSILRREDDEVYLHSRFLAELLDPDGGHCQGHALLEAFLQQVGIDGFRMRNVSVRREYRDIDVLVTNDDQAVVIENKIHAHDQKRQLERYYDTVRDQGFEDVFVVYLTLDGSSPSRYSLGSLADRIGDDGVICASYEDDVHAWLETSIGLTSRFPALRETLVQYQRLVERLTGQSLSKGYIMEIKQLITDETNIELAVSISRAVLEAQIDVQLAFWEELERQLREAGFQVADDQPCRNRYSRKKIRKYYETQRSGRYYGITLKLAEYDEETDLVFYIKMGWNVHYGFRAYRDTTSKIAKEPQFDGIAALVMRLDPSLERTQHSIGWKSVPQLSFKSFNTPTVWALTDPEKCERIVSELTDEIAAHINGFMALYEPGASSADAGVQANS